MFQLLNAGPYRYGLSAYMSPSRPGSIHHFTILSAWFAPGGNLSRSGLSKSFPNTRSSPGMSAFGMKLKDMLYWSYLCSSEVKYFSAVTGDSGGNPVKCRMRTHNERMMDD